ncbi:hypothetical protein ACIPY0_20380 [Paenarthrobacter nicotinovorans]|uniref:hypothetical protein n=1 Tax=Paenarthrobacter nicotinovorans TaxID=29320 RepID=UPI003820B662
MASYTRNGNRANLENLRVQQQIAAAEIHRAEQELAAIHAAELELARTRRRQQQINQQLTEARERLNQPQKVILPPPIHGGQLGLLRATKEAAGWDKRNNPKRKVA